METCKAIVENADEVSTTMLCGKIAVWEISIEGSGKLVSYACDNPEHIATELNWVYSLGPDNLVVKHL